MKSLGVKVKLVDGEKALKLLRRLGLLRGELKPLASNGYLVIPIQSPPPSQILEAYGLSEAEIVEEDFPERVKARSLPELLKGKIPDELLSKIPRSIDIVGHVAIVELPEELEPHGVLLGKALMEVHRNVKTVLAKATPVKGEYRVREFKLLAGEPRTETVHSEFGCRFRLDVRKVYFSPRLSFEHNRVASQVRDGETVLDMFAGVGPFSILIARRVRNVRVYAVDINPEAYRYLTENIRLNRVEGRVSAFLGDIRTLAKNQFKNLKFDRIIMNLPGEASKYLREAFMLSKPGTIIHYYCFTDNTDEETVKSGVRRLSEEAGGRVGEVLNVRVVREVAPRKWQVAVDFEVA